VIVVSRERTGGERTGDRTGIDAELRDLVGSAKALAYIVVFDGDAPGRIYAMTRPTVVVGRDDEADMQVLDASVSARHARIVNSGQGFEVEDLGSTNGMFLGGERIRRAELQNGDRLTVGGVDLMFLLERPTDATIKLPDRARLAALAAAPTLIPAPRPLTALRPSAEEDGPSLVEVVRKAAAVARYLRANVQLIVALAMLGTAGGLASVSFSPPTIGAVSEVKLLPRMNIASNPQERMQPEINSTTFVKDAERTLTQPEFVRETLTKLQGARPDDGLVGAVIGRIKVEETGDHLFRVSYRCKTRQRPAPMDLLPALLGAYVQGEIAKTAREDSAKVGFLRDQLRTVEADLSHIGAERAGFRELNSDRLPEDAAGTMSNRHALEAKRADLMSEIHRVDGELQTEQGQLSENRAVARTKFQWSETYRQSLAEVNRKLSEAYARGLNDGHPEIQQLKDERQRLQALANQELQNETTPLVRDADPNYQQAHHRVEKLRADLAAARANLAETERSLAKVRRVEQDLPRIEQTLADLDHRQASTKTLHGELFAKLKQAEIQLNLEKVSAESRFEITPPIFERPPGAVIFAKRALVGLAAGLLLAALWLAFLQGRAVVAQALAATQTPAGRRPTPRVGSQTPFRRRNTP
jgi:hypothetical protein